MSSIGKIFIVLNLILSAAFVGWAANALGKTEDLTAELVRAQEAYEQEVKKKDAEIAKLGVEKNELSDSQRQFREQRDQLQITADRLQSQLEEEKRRSDQLDGAIAKIQATLNDYNQTIAQMTQDKDRAIERAHEAEMARDGAKDDAQKAELARRDAEEAQKNAEIKIGDLEGEKLALMSKVSEMDVRLQGAIERMGGSTVDFAPIPLIKASVLGVRYDKGGGPGLVMLNVGKNKEVRPGYTFHVYRGKTYKGQVRVEDVQEEVCSAVILGGPEKTSIVQGDSASTNL